MASEFDLLSFVGVRNADLPLTEQERRDEEIRRKQAFDDMQYRAHIEQERRRKERAERNFSGRCHRFPYRDQLHHYGNYWFAEGTVPSTHDVVGKAPPPPADHPVAHTIDGRSGGIRQGTTGPAAGQSPGVRSPPGHYEHAAFGAPTAYRPQRDEPVVVLRPRMPPPSPEDVARRAWQAELDKESAGDITNSQSGRAHRHAAATSSPRRGEFNPSHRNVEGYRSPGLRDSATPYAPHYPLDDELVPRSPHPDRQGILRGTGGGRDDLESEARAAQSFIEAQRQRAEHDRRKRMQAEMKATLDEAVRKKRDQQVQARREEEKAVFGYSLPLRAADEPRTRADYERQKREELQRTWEQQAAEHRAREEADRARTAPDKSMWWVGGQRKDDRQKQEPEGPQDPRASWKRAMLEHQEKAALAERAKQREAAELEAKTLSPNIANYAERIVLAERQRKEAQRAYQHDLDEQVRTKEYKRRSLIAEGHRRDNRFSRGPFERYPNNLGA